AVARPVPGDLRPVAVLARRRAHARARRRSATVGRRRNWVAVLTRLYARAARRPSNRVRGGGPRCARRRRHDALRGTRPGRRDVRELLPGSTVVREEGRLRRAHPPPPRRAALPALPPRGGGAAEPLGRRVRLAGNQRPQGGRVGRIPLADEAALVEFAVLLLV